jgi:hypothetical protein
MQATMIDDRRRLVLPPEFKPRSAVTVQVIDQETILVKLAKPSQHHHAMLLPDVKTLQDDPIWDKVEAAFTSASNKGLAPLKNENF